MNIILIDSWKNVYEGTIDHYETNGKEFKVYMLDVQLIKEENKYQRSSAFTIILEDNKYEDMHEYGNENLIGWLSDHMLASTMVFKNMTWTAQSFLDYLWYESDAWLTDKDLEFKNKTFNLPRNQQLTEAEAYLKTKKRV